MHEWRRKEYEYIPWFLREAKKNNCKIHALGFAAGKNLKRYHFFSVDSSTWQTFRFGQLQYFNKKTKQVERISKKPLGSRIKIAKRNEVEELNFKAWKEFQKYAEVNL